MLSCTDELLREVGIAGEGARASASTRTRARTSARSRSCAARFGKRNIVVLDDFGLLGPHTLRRALHPPSDDRARAARGARRARVHVPVVEPEARVGRVPLPELIAAGVSVAIGADGAPCNNNLDGFLELRLAALLHKPRLGPRTLPAPEVVRMATLGGAAALGLARPASARSRSASAAT